MKRGGVAARRRITVYWRIEEAGEVRMRLDWSHGKPVRQCLSELCGQGLACAR